MLKHFCTYIWGQKSQEVDLSGMCWMHGGACRKSGPMCGCQSLGNLSLNELLVATQLVHSRPWNRLLIFRPPVLTIHSQTTLPNRKLQVSWLVHPFMTMKHALWLTWNKAEVLSLWRILTPWVQLHIQHLFNHKPDIHPFSTLLSSSLLT